MTFEFGSPDKVSSKNEEKPKQPTIEIVSEVFDPKKIKIAQREALMWGTDQGAAIAFGNVMHEILSFVKTAGDIDLAVAMAIENGLITMSQKAEVIATLSAIVANVELVDFFASDKKVFNEQVILIPNGTTLKPDRVVIKENEAYLLDYKTGSHQQKYVQQLLSYEAALISIGLSVKKKALVYIGETIEVVPL